MFIYNDFRIRFHHINLNGCKCPLGWPETAAAMTICRVTDIDEESLNCGKVIATGIYWSARNLDKSKARKKAMGDALIQGFQSKSERHAFWQEYYEVRGGRW